MFIQYIIYACIKYEKYFRFNGIDTEDVSHKMVQKYKRLREILTECRQQDLDAEQADRIFGKEVDTLYHDIQCKEFICKVTKVAFLGDMKMIARFMGDYYAEIDFNEVLKLPEVQEKHPEYENLRKPEVFHKVFPAEYHVFFGERPRRYDVTSGFIWHFGKRIKHQINEDAYEWIKGI